MPTLPALRMYLACALLMSACVQADIKPNPDLIDENEASPNLDSDSSLSDHIDDAEDSLLPDETETDEEILEGEGSTATLVDVATVLGGDFSCLGGNLPPAPVGDKVSLSGTTVQFKSNIAVHGVTIDVVAGDGELLASTDSDDRGRYTLEFDDTEAARDGFIELSRHDAFTTRMSSSHPQLTYQTDADLGIATAIERDLLNISTPGGIDPELGVIHGELYDCLGATEVSGASITIEPASGQLLFTTPEFSFSADIERTTLTSSFYFVNVEPGTYVVTVSAEGKDGEEPIVVNSVVYEVVGSTLSTQTIYPE